MYVYMYVHLYACIRVCVCMCLSYCCVFVHSRAAEDKSIVQLEGLQGSVSSQKLHAFEGAHQSKVHCQHEII